MIFFGVVNQIEKFNIIILQQLGQGSRNMMLLERKVAGKFIVSIVS